MRDNRLCKLRLHMGGQPFALPTEVAFRPLTTPIAPDSTHIGKRDCASPAGRAQNAIAEIAGA